MRLPVALTLVGVLLVGCTSATGNGPATFVSEGSDQLSIIQWTEDDGVLTGTYQAVSASDESDGPPTKSSDSSFQGKVSDGAVDLTFDGLTTVTGKLSGDALTLSVPQKNGGVAPVTYHRSTLESYNRDVAALGGRVSAQRSEQAQQAAEASAAAELAQQEQALSESVGDLPTLTSAITTAAANLSTVVGGVRSALKAQRTALATVKSVNCIDVYSAISDEGTAYSDVMTAESDFETATSDLAGAEQELRAAMASIQTAVQSVQSNGGSVPELSNLTAATRALRSSATSKKTASTDVQRLTESAKQVDAAANALTGRAC